MSRNVWVGAAILAFAPFLVPPQANAQVGFGFNAGPSWSYSYPYPYCYYYPCSYPYFSSGWGLGREAGTAAGAAAAGVVVGAVVDSMAAASAAVASVAVVSVAAVSAVAFEGAVSAGAGVDFAEAAASTAVDAVDARNVNYITAAGLCIRRRLLL